MPDDRPRYVGRTRDYVTDPSRRMVREPEPLRPDELQELTDDVHRAHRARLVGEWSKCEARILSSLQHYLAVVGRVPPGVNRAVRNVERTTKAAGRHIGS
jgi:hypothetical protein